MITWSIDAEKSAGGPIASQSDVDGKVTNTDLTLASLSLGQLRTGISTTVVVEEGEDPTYDPAEGGHAAIIVTNYEGSSVSLAPLAPLTCSTVILYNKGSAQFTLLYHGTINVPSGATVIVVWMHDRYFFHSVLTR